MPSTSLCTFTSRRRKVASCHSSCVLRIRRNYTFVGSSIDIQSVLFPIVRKINLPDYYIIRKPCSATYAGEKSNSKRAPWIDKSDLTKQIKFHRRKAKIAYKNRFCKSFNLTSQLEEEFFDVVFISPIGSDAWLLKIS